MPQLCDLLLSRFSSLFIASAGLYRLISSLLVEQFRILVNVLSICDHISDILTEEPNFSQLSESANQIDNIQKFVTTSGLLSERIFGIGYDASERVVVGQGSDMIQKLSDKQSRIREDHSEMVLRKVLLW